MAQLVLRLRSESIRWDTLLQTPNRFRQLGTSACPSSPTYVQCAFGMLHMHFRRPAWPTAAIRRQAGTSRSPQATLDSTAGAI